jgi:hypothetical protein
MSVGTSGGNFAIRTAQERNSSTTKTQQRQRPNKDKDRTKTPLPNTRAERRNSAREKAAAMAMPVDPHFRSHKGFDNSTIVSLNRWNNYKTSKFMEIPYLFKAYTIRCRHNNGS